MDVIPKLNTELSDALHESGGELKVVDPTTNRVYVVVDQSVLKRAKDVLQRQEEEDLAAIQRGIDDVKAGRTQPLSEAFDSIREEFDSKFPQ